MPDVAFGLDRLDLTNKADAARLSDAARRRGARLIVLDFPMPGGRKLDALRAALEKLCQTTGAAVLVTHASTSGKALEALLDDAENAVALQLGPDVSTATLRSLKSREMAPIDHRILRRLPGDVFAVSNT